MAGYLYRFLCVAALCGMVAGPLLAQRGDVNNDGTVDGADVQFLTSFFFANGPASARACLSDVDASASADVRDVFYLINFVYGGGAPPAYISEVCNGLDDDCDGVIDNGASASCPAGDPICQTSPTCTNGACLYSNRDAVAGTTTCGNGVCRVTQNNCIGGHPHTCTPNSAAASIEVCNGLDDNCDGLIDNGPFQDGFEPNNSCAQVVTLAPVGSDETKMYTATLYPAGDADYFHVHATETDSVCADCSCGLFCFTEKYRFNVTLTVPAGAGSYRVSVSRTCGVAEQSATVAAGTTVTVPYLLLNGSCAVGTTDSYDLYIWITGLDPPGFECIPYTLTYNFQSGVCN